MKNFNFKNKGSVLRTVEEPVIKKKKWGFDRIVYLTLIIFISFIVIRYTYNVLNVIKGNGQIVFQKLPVNFTSDIRLGKIMIEEGTEVCKGDTLFHYNIEKESISEDLTVRTNEVKNKMLRDLLSIERDILLKKAQRKAINLQLKQLDNLYEEKVKMVLLEVENYTSLDELQAQKNRLNGQKILLNQEISDLEKFKSKAQTIGDKLVSTYQAVEQDFYYISPVDGISGTVNFEPNQVCYKQQEVVSVHNPEQVQIRAYFSQKYNDYLKPNTKVKIKFQDGTITYGRISNSYITTYALPSEFQKKYEPTERNILVDITPINNESEELLRKFYLMDSELFIYRWEFPLL